MMRSNKFAIAGCQRLVPSMKHAIEIKTVAGLRPGRSQVRLETEKRGNGKATIIHNVGCVCFSLKLF
jgi:D-amino-acid oxidase